MSRLIQFGNNPCSFTNDLMEDPGKMVSFSDYVNSIDKLCRNEIITPIEARQLLGFDNGFFRRESEKEVEE